MITRLTGTLVAVDRSDPKNLVVELDRDGLVYAIDVPAYVADALDGRLETDATLHTLAYLEGNPAGGNLVPRLIGFLGPRERAFFERFRTVKGLGVRKALRALAEPPGVIAQRIEAGDAKALARLPEIGKRLAETIVATLRGKVTIFALAGDELPTDAPAARPTSMSNAEREAAAILTAWGDRPADAEDAVLAARADADVASEADAREIVQAVYQMRART